ncbi:GNAT family N-acetyltransferase [Actinophytocola oryzae]|uniref:Acetyltransferase (GNAT) family protein n=1 Tax=Actinophytocola oryzae TaxID=502181 RepID=A0A4R7V4Z2_9PSEU|nr:GNAT family N-acetyltransferase [Actinophytocola oryzae]TDV43727.1 acetyltransferase (GNAT) family protein [Actinophytocola oryzae]
MTGLVPASALDRDQAARTRTVYEEAFPRQLRTPFEQLTDHRPDERLLTLLDGGVPVGIAFIRELGTTGTVFLRYFAVDRSRRGQGVGTRLWHALCAELAGFALLYLDIEDPEESGIDEVERTVRQWRVTFYARLGAIVLPVRNYTPPHGAQRHPMLLLAADLRAEVPGPLRPGGLAHAVRSVYEYRYGITENDPLVVTTLTRSGLR